MKWESKGQTDLIQGWNEQSDITFGLWNVKIRSGFPESRELQLTTPHTSVDNTFPFLSTSAPTLSLLDMVVTSEWMEGLAYLSTIASSDSAISK